MNNRAPKKARNHEHEYWHCFTDNEGLMYPVGDGESPFYELKEETFENIIEEAEARGYEAARREIINALTGKTTSKLASEKKRLEGLNITDGDIKTSSPITYNETTGELTVRLSFGASMPILKKPYFIEDNPSDSVLHMLPDEASDSEESEVEEPEFLKDAPTKPKEKVVTIEDLEAELQVGWYQYESELRYWDGSVWREGSNAVSALKSRIKKENLEKLEFLG